jgi:putative ABC transport system ATP-binding protein
MIGADDPISAMVDIDELQFQYGDSGFQLSVPALCVADGERVAFIGPSGSGKTTLLHLIAGIVPPAGGTIVTNRVDVTALGEPARRDFRVVNVGLVFQEFELLEYLSVLDNILLPYRINSALRLDGEVRARADDLADRVGIADKLGRFPSQLSQGERQRVAVCRAVVPGPPLLLADEPTGNLDPMNKIRVLDILLDVADATDATLITVTHDHDLLHRFGRVVDFKSFSEAPA